MWTVVTSLSFLVLLTCLKEKKPINEIILIILTEIYRNFSQLHQADAYIYIKLAHEILFPQFLHFIPHEQLHH